MRDTSPIPPHLLTLQEILQLLGSHVVLEPVDIDEDEFGLRHNKERKEKQGRESYIHTHARDACG